MFGDDDIENENDINDGDDDADDSDDGDNEGDDCDVDKKLFGTALMTTTMLTPPSRSLFSLASLFALSVSAVLRVKLDLSKSEIKYEKLFDLTFSSKHFFNQAFPVHENYHCHDHLIASSSSSMASSRLCPLGMFGSDLRPAAL